MKKLIIIFIGLVSFGLFGQDNDVPKQWTLEACIKYAFDNNISVKQSQLDMEDAEVNRADAFERFLPNFNINANNNWNTGLSTNVTTGVLQNQIARNFSLGATVGLNLFSGLENWKRFDRAKLSALASQYSLEQMEDDIALTVANSYLQILVSKQIRDVLIKQNEITLQQLEQTQLQIDAGTVPRGDILELEATDADEKRQIVVAENDVKIALVSLAQLLLIDDYENFQIADESYDVPLTDLINRDIKEIIEEAKKKRYEILVAETNLEIAEKDLEIARNVHMPTVSAFFNYSTRENDISRSALGGVDPDNPTRQIGVVETTGAPVVTQNLTIVEVPPPSFVDQLWQNDGLTYGLQLSIPIFNNRTQRNGGLTTRNNVKRNKINVERSENNLEQAKLDLESNVYQAYVDAQGAAKAYEASQKAVDAQQIAFDFAKERFEVGSSNAFELNQSKIRLTNAENRLIQSKYDFIFRIKVLELFFGERPVD